jgi:hypothetical protein
VLAMIQLTKLRRVDRRRNDRGPPRVRCARNRGRSSPAPFSWTVVGITLATLAGSCDREPSAPTAESRTRSQETSKSSAYEKTFSGGPVRLRARVPQTEIDLAGILRYEETLEVEAGFEADFPEYLPEDFADLVIVDLDAPDVAAFDATKVPAPPAGNSNTPESLDPSEPGSSRVTPGRTSTVRKRTIVLEPLRSGELSISPFEVFFRETGKETESSFSTEAIPIRVRPIEHLESLRVSDAKGIVRITAAESRGTSAIWIGVGTGVGLLVLAGVAVWLRRRPVREAPPPTPEETAWENLRRLIALDLIAKKETERFFVYLSGILRQYVEGRFQVRAPELTTEEFFVEASKRAELASSRENLERFLRLSDQVKFGRFEPAQETIQASFDVVKRFIEESTPREP